jgi:biopolymer transport protein ExbD
MKSQMKLKKMDRINLVPILDSVFIFIFFLLSSPQMSDLNDISFSLNYSAKKVVENNQETLNLRVEIFDNKISFTRGTLKKERKEFASSNSGEISDYLRSLKRFYPNENKIFIRTSSKVQVNTLVKILDLLKEDKKNSVPLFNKFIFQ